MKKTIYNIGDSVWVASFDLQEEQVTCPVCFGNLSVILVLGNGDHLSLPCDYCGKGRDVPTGRIREYRREPRCRAIVIFSREITENLEGTQVEYRTSDSHCYHSDEVFETQVEAITEARRRADVMAGEERTRAVYLKKNVNQTYSWNAGYHLREAKRLREQIAYHERQATLCKEKSKGE
jgi:hypothetical protein